MTRFFVSHIFAHNFRNLLSFSLDIHPKLNVFYGNNGQGKTNITEAISIALSTKALRPTKHVSDLVAHGQEKGRIRVHCDGDSGFESCVSLAPGSKRFQIEGKPTREFSGLLKRVAVVSFVPEEMQIVSASSSFRRRALNQIALALFPSYLGAYRNYEKALFARNQLLKQKYCDPLEFASFNQIYANHSAEITRYRQEAFSLFLPFFKRSVRQIMAERFTITAQYKAAGSSSLEETLTQMQDVRVQEQARRITLCGPRLDDIIFTINEKPCRFSASRGQARAIVLALKIGLLNAIAELRGTPTVLLLDDVAGELDPEKINHLMTTVESLDVQTFLTTAHLESLSGLDSNHGKYKVEQGRIVSPAIGL